MEVKGGRVQNEDLGFVVETVKSCITTYDVVVTPLDLYFYYFKDQNTNLGECFDSIRKILIPRGYVPFLSEEGENFLIVRHRPETRYKSSRVNLFLFFLTLASTIFVGAEFSTIFLRPGPLWLLFDVLYGFVFFSVPLLLILGIHELGHFIVARRFKVKASFPFFIPVPFSIGTLGAFISLRDPIPNRKAMVEIGAAGPIFGFATAFPLLFVANYLQKIFLPITSGNQGFTVQFPVIYHLLGLISPTSSAQPLFPMVLAVWVGIFATALNLLPISQLDGGHVARGLLGRRSFVVSYGFLVLIVVLSFYPPPGYTGWLLLAILALFLGLTHPPPLDDYSKIPYRDLLIGILVLVLFILSFTYRPLMPG